MRFMLLRIVAHRGRFLKFGLVGAAGAAFNTGLLYLLVDRGHLPPLVGVTISTEATILLNFFINDRWTFADVTRAHPLWRRALHYNSIAFGGLLLSLAIVALLTGVFATHYLYANLCAIAASALWNYVGNIRFTWRRPHHESIRDVEQFSFASGDDLLAEEIGA
jgi:dolichol-phosphate mannosyltransferase